MKALGVLALVLASLIFVRAEDPPQSPATQFQPEANSPAPPPGPPIEIEAKYLEVSPKTAAEFFGDGFSPILSFAAAEDLLRRLSERPDVDILSAPRVTTKAGRKALIKVVREFPFPTEFEPPAKEPPTATTPEIWSPSTPSQFETRDVGLTLEVEPNTTADGRILADLTPEVVEFLGFINYGANRPQRDPSAPDPLASALVPAPDDPTPGPANVINQPIFHTRSIKTTVAVPPDHTVLLGGLVRRSDRKMIDVIDREAPKPSTPSDRLLYVFVTLRFPDYSPKTAPSAPATAVPTPLPASGLPYGQPVPGKPGFITSPWAPDDGQVDVRGFPSGTEVKCPYTQKLFLVP